MDEKLEIKIKCFNTDIEIAKTVLDAMRSNFRRLDILVNGNKDGSEQKDSAEFLKYEFSKRLQYLRNDYRGILRQTLLIPCEDFENIQQDLRNDYKNVRDEFLELVEYGSIH